MIHNIDAILKEHFDFPGERAEVLSETNNHVFQVTDVNDKRYILKCFDSRRSNAYRREVGMRDCLDNFSDIRFPKIIRNIQVADVYYLLLEYIAGDNLQAVWDNDRSQASREMSKLGKMLASLHQIPVEKARKFLSLEDVLYSRVYFVKMKETIIPHQQKLDTEQLLEKCYGTIIQTSLKNSVTHADFGPHQIVVTKDSQWVLLDFEYAAIAPFADDLSGTEIRLEQRNYPNIDNFLCGYTKNPEILDSYNSVRNSFKAYNLLAMLTYTIYQGKTPTKDKLERLYTLLTQIT